MKSSKYWFAVVVAIGMSAWSQQPQFDWNKIKQTVAENKRNSKPMIFSAEAVNKLGLKVGCEELRQNLLSCKPYQCIKKIKVLMAEVYTDISVLGFNRANHCAFNAGTGERFFIPRADLNDFTENFLGDAKVRQRSEASLKKSVTVIDVEKNFNGQVCKYSYQIETKSDTSQKIKVTSENRDKYSSSPQITGADGATYAHPTTTTYGKIQFASKNPSVCQKKRITIVEELHQKNLAVEASPENIGFPDMDAELLDSQQQTSPAPPATISAPTPTGAISFLVNGKQQVDLHLGDTYKFLISNIPASTKIIGKCEGASGCSDWFFYGRLDDKKQLESGVLKISSQLAPNWNIPLVTYTLWVASEDGKLESNRVLFQIGPKVQKPRPFPVAAAGKGLQLLINEELDTNVVPGLGSLFYSIDGGVPGEEVVARCKGPSDCSYFFPPNSKLNEKGQLETAMGLSKSLSLKPGKYEMVVTSKDGKSISNKASINIKLDKD